MARNPNRIPKIINALKKTYNLIRFHDLYVKNSNDLEEFLAVMKDLNYLEIESYWMRNPDYRFTQLLVNTGKKPIFCYFEPIHYLEDSKIMKDLNIE